LSVARPVEGADFTLFDAIQDAADGFVKGPLIFAATEDLFLVGTGRDGNESIFGTACLAIEAEAGDALLKLALPPAIGGKLSDDGCAPKFSGGKAYAVGVVEDVALLIALDDIHEAEGAAFFFGGFLIVANAAFFWLFPGSDGKASPVTWPTLSFRLFRVVLDAAEPAVHPTRKPLLLPPSGSPNVGKACSWDSSPPSSLGRIAAAWARISSVRAKCAG